MYMYVHVCMYVHVPIKYQHISTYLYTMSYVHTVVYTIDTGSEASTITHVHQLHLLVSSIHKHSVMLLPDQWHGYCCTSDSVLCSCIPGNHCSDTAEIFFEDVVVPASNVIGEQGQGFTYQMMQFQEERMWATASGGRGL